MESLKIVVDAEVCEGCRICELVCSFHHKKVFSPDLSSVKIFRNNRSGKIEWSIDSTCDSCENEAQPLCVEHCLPRALKEVT